MKGNIRDKHGSAIVWWLREKGILPLPKEPTEKEANEKEISKKAKLPKWVKITRDLLIISAIFSLLTADILGLIISIIWVFLITSKKRIVVWLFVPFILLMNLFLLLLFPLFAIIRILVFLPLAYGLIKQLGGYYTEGSSLSSSLKNLVVRKSKFHTLVNVLFYGILSLFLLLVLLFFFIIIIF